MHIHMYVPKNDFIWIINLEIYAPLLLAFKLSDFMFSHRPQIRQTEGQSGNTLKFEKQMEGISKILFMPRMNCKTEIQYIKVMLILRQVCRIPRIYKVLYILINK